MKELFSTREVAKFLGVNEKMVYSLISEKGLPATKVTGKWLFPRHLVEQWVETNTINFPEFPGSPLPDSGLLVVTGSNDPLLDRTISMFNSRYPDNLAVFGNLGSMGGLRALRLNLCHIASSHLLQENENEYNFEFADRELDRMPAVVNFCMREQGLIIAGDNPKQIGSLAEVNRPGIKIANRPLGTGTRLLFDRELEKAGIDGAKIEGYGKEMNRHLDAAIEVQSGRVDACPGIRAAASMLGLGFIPIRWERYDLLISKDRFFDKAVQLFVGLLRDPAFLETAVELEGYDTGISGKMVYPDNR